MASVGPIVWYCDSAQWTAVTAWPSNTAKAAGALVRQNAAPTVGNERVFVCIVAGTTTNGTEPTWVVTKGAKTTDNTVTWQECTGQPGVNGDTTNSPTWLQNKNTAVTLGLIIYDSVSGALQIVSTAGTTGNGSAPSFSGTAGTTTADNAVTWTSLGAASNFAKWAAPFDRLQSAVATNWMAAGNTLFVGDDHAETQSSAMTIAFPGVLNNPNNVYCVDHTVAVPPGSTNLATTATITTTGNSAMTLSGSFALNGIILSYGSGAVSATLSFGSFGGHLVRADNCSFKKGGTSANTTPILGTSNTRVQLFNTTIQQGATGDLIGVNGADLYWANTPSAIAGATLPTTLLNAGFTNITCVLDGVDLSALGSGKTIVGAGSSGGHYSLQNCKLGSSVTIAGTPTGVNTTDVVNSDSSGTDYQFQRYWYQGTEVPETTIVRTGGASNGTTALSAKITTTANSLWVSPFEAQPMGIWNPTTGANVTVTLRGIWNAASLPNNDQVWFDCEYMGSSGSPIASFATCTKANNLAAGTALTADTSSAWDSLVAARQNTHVYTTGNTIKVASNPGRVFFCTSGGTSAGSEPGGYASAVDGGSVTDSGATFRAGFRFLMAVTLSAPQPQLVGDLYCIVKAALPSSTFWIDPLPVLS